jgi:hypothetical protein
MNNSISKPVYTNIEDIIIRSLKSSCEEGQPESRTNELFMAPMGAIEAILFQNQELLFNPEVKDSLIARLELFDWGNGIKLDAILRDLSGRCTKLHHLCAFTLLQIQRIESLLNTNVDREEILKELKLCTHTFTEFIGVWIKYNENIKVGKGELTFMQFHNRTYGVEFIRSGI